MYAAIHHGGASGWAFLFATIVWLALFFVGVGLMELSWRPFREAQRRANADRRSARDVSPIDQLKEAETVVHAYSHLVSESGTRLPESALPYSKGVIRRSLLLWAALDRDAVARDRLCSMYGLLEDFLPHDDWLVLNEWDRLIKTKDVDAMLKTDKDFGERAVRLMNETTARSAERMVEFKLKLHQLDEG